jgi:hypothetical protein
VRLFISACTGPASTAWCFSVARGEGRAAASWLQKVRSSCCFQLHYSRCDVNTGTERTYCYMQDADSQLQSCVAAGTYVMSYAHQRHTGVLQA